MSQAQSFAGLRCGEAGNTYREGCAEPLRPPEEPDGSGGACRATCARRQLGRGGAEVP